MKLFFLGFPRMDNPIVTLHPQSNVCWLCEHYLKSKEKASTITSVSFKTLINLWVLRLSKEYAKEWTAVEKCSSSFQSFHFIFDKCNTITTELLENKTVKCYSQCHHGFTNDKTKQTIKTTNKRNWRDFNRNNSGYTMLPSNEKS